jgi:hypothetical protein
MLSFTSVPKTLTSNRMTNVLTIKSQNPPSPLIAYKVFYRRRDRVLTSVVAPYKRFLPSTGFRYHKTNWNHSKYGPFFVFDTLKRATQWGQVILGQWNTGEDNPYDDLEVWEVEIQSPKTINIALDTEQLTLMKVLNFWNKGLHEENSSILPPVGTFVCRSLRLISLRESFSYDY